MTFGGNRYDLHAHVKHSYIKESEMMCIMDGIIYLLIAYLEKTLNESHII